MVSNSAGTKKDVGGIAVRPRDVIAFQSADGVVRFLSFLLSLPDAFPAARTMLDFIATLLNCRHNHSNKFNQSRRNVLSYCLADVIP